ncbi:unnamed protein product [Notodromas monacha]|uniref:Uncharacterized protein n=1 Tax=Notodromas monacha TaxID=399045 RepID=A0A7R9BM35_9CRUS|nr:unnamed protein product [Notodromas monacha]CAG0916521.1 unnamed protein product [Notodromas monacha]
MNIPAYFYSEEDFRIVIRKAIEMEGTKSVERLPETHTPHCKDCGAASKSCGKTPAGDTFASLRSGVDVNDLHSRVLRMVGSAENDEQFQDIISHSLASVLLELSSQQEGVRKKVMELIVYMNRRLKTNPNIQLPVQALISQYQNPSASSFVLNFTIIYLKMGIPRLDVAKQVELLPSLIHCLNNKPIQHCDSLMRVIVPIFQHVKFPADPHKCRTMFAFDEDSPLADSLLKFMLDVLILPLVHNVTIDATLPIGTAITTILNVGSSNGNRNGQSTSDAATSTNTSCRIHAPMGMSDYSFKRTTGDNPLSEDELEQVKLGIIRFTSCGTFKEESVVCHLIVGSADTRYSIVNESENALRKISPSVDWGKASVVSSLLDLYLGTRPSSDQVPEIAGYPLPTSPTLRLELRRLPSAARVRLKILPYLLKSPLSATIFPDNLYVPIESFFGFQTLATGLCQMTMQFVYHVIQYCPEEYIKPVGKVLLDAALKLLEENLESTKLRSLLYVAVGKLSRKNHCLLIEDPNYLRRLLVDILREEAEVEPYVECCMLDVGIALQKFYGSVDSDELIKKRGLVQGIVKRFFWSASDPAFSIRRKIAVNLVSAVFPPSSVELAHLLLHAAAFSSDEPQVEEIALTFLSLEAKGEGLTKDVQFSSKIGPCATYPAFHLLITELEFEVHETNSITFGQPWWKTSHIGILAISAYLRACLGFEAGLGYSPGDTDIRALRKFLVTKWDIDERTKLDSLASYAAILHSAVARCVSENSDVTNPVVLLLEIFAAVPEFVIPNSVFLGEVEFYKRFLDTKKYVVRNAACQILGLIAAFGMDDKAFFAFLKVLLAQALAKFWESSNQHICHLVFGYAVGNRHSIFKGIQTGEISRICANSPWTVDLIERMGKFGCKTDASVVGVVVKGKKKKHTKDSKDCWKTWLPQMNLAEIESSVIVQQFTSLLGIFLYRNRNRIVLVAGACVALGEIGRRGPLSLQTEGESGLESKRTTNGGGLDNGSDEDSPSVKTVVDRLLEITGDSSLPVQTRAKSAICSGLVCMGDPQFPHVRYIMKAVLKMASQVKEVELLLAMGKCLSFAGVKSSGSVVNDAWVTTLQNPAPGKLLKSSEDFKWLLEQMLVESRNSAIRQAHCVFLFSLLIECSNQQALQDRLVRVQRALIDFIADVPDIIQDLALKAIVMVFYASTGNATKAVFDGLLEYFRISSGTKEVTGVKMKEVTSESGKLMLLKEFCEFALDLKKPDVAYKMLDIFCLQELQESLKKDRVQLMVVPSSSTAANALKSEICSLVPKLFRARFDPNAEVKAAMDIIWKTLLLNTNVIYSMFVPIIEELIIGLNHSEWRVRESCCDAVSEIMTGCGHLLLLKHVPCPEGHSKPVICDNDSNNSSPFNAPPTTPKRTASKWTFTPSDQQLSQDAIGRLWTALLVNIGDEQESVRKAGEHALEAFRKGFLVAAMTTCLQADQLIELAVPALVNVGLTSSVPEARLCSMKCIHEFCTESRFPALKSQVHVLIPALLKYRGETEPEFINQLSATMGEGAEPALQETYARMRLASLHFSPAMESIKKLTSLVDENSLKELVPALIDLMKTSSSLVTKAGCAHVVTQLVHCHGQLLQPYSGKLLAALVGNLNDRNILVRKNYANAIGFLMGVAKITLLQKLGDKLQVWYLDKDEDEESHLICSITVRSVWRNSPKVAAYHVYWSMPLAFFAMHRPPLKENRMEDSATETSSRVWAEVWNEGASNESEAILLHLNGIIGLVEAGLNSKSNLKKVQTGLMIISIAEKAGQDLDPLTLCYFTQVLNDEIDGKFWPGKEIMLQALAAVAHHGALVISCNTDLGEKSVDLVLMEMKRIKTCMSYRREAIAVAGILIDLLQLDRFDELWDLVLPAVMEPQSTSNTTLDSSDSARGVECVQEAAWSALRLAWPYGPRDVKRLMPMLDTLVDRVTSSTVPVMAAMTSCMEVIFNDAFEERGAFSIAGVGKDAFGKVLHLAAQFCRHVIVHKSYTTMQVKSLGIMTRCLIEMKDPADAEISLHLTDIASKMQATVAFDDVPEIVSAVGKLASALPASATSKTPSTNAVSKCKKMTHHPQKRPLDDTDGPIGDGD